MTTIQTQNDASNNQNNITSIASGGEQLQKQDSKAKKEIKDLLTTYYKGQDFTRFAIMISAGGERLDSWKTAFTELVDDGFILPVEQKLLGMVYMLASNCDQYMSLESDKLDLQNKGNKNKKILASKIVLVRGEGLTEECNIPHTVSSYEEAAKILQRWSLTVRGGYDKCDFTVTFEDESEYTGRYDLKNLDGEREGFNFSIKNSINSYLSYLAERGDKEAAEFLNTFDV